MAGLIANSGPGFIRRVRSSEAGLPAPSLGYARAHGPLGCGCLPLWFGVGLSPSRMPFSSGFSFACYRKIRSAVPCAVHRAAPSCPGRTCTSAYARAEMRMRVPPPLVWGRALSVATVFFVWFFFCVSSQYLVRCAVHSAAPSRPGGTRTCAYARRARARAEMRDASGRDRDDAPRSSLRSQLGGTVIVCAVRPRRICVSSTPARLGLGTCHCERSYISSSGLRPEGTSDDVTVQSATASHGIHVTNRARMSRSTPPITNGVVVSTPARLGLGTYHYERRYISSSGLRPEGTSDDATMQSVTASHGIHVTNRTRISRPTPPISNDVVTSGTGAGLVGPPQDPHLAKAMAASGHHTGRGLASEPPPPPITNGVVSRSEATSDTGAGLVDKNNVVDPNQDPGPLTGPGNEEHTTGIGMTQQWLRPPRLADHMWLRPPGFSRPPYNHHKGDFGMNCTHGAHTMVCKTTLRSHVCSSTGGRSHCLSCALDAHMFVLRRTSKHNQPPHMGLSSAAPCQAAWPFSVTLRLSSVHQKATSWARRRCAQETIPPPSASYTHERTSNPLFRRFLETPSRPVLSTAVTAPTGIRPRHKIFGQSTISPTTQKPHQTKTETGYGARPTVQHTRI